MGLNIGNPNDKYGMNKFVKFSSWLESRVAEDMMQPNMQQQPNAQKMPQQPMTPQAQAAAKKTQMAMSKYNIDPNKFAKNPQQMLQMQNKVAGDPQFGPDVAINLFKTPQ